MDNASICCRVSKHYLIIFFQRSNQLDIGLQKCLNMYYRDLKISTCLKSYQQKKLYIFLTPLLVVIPRKWEYILNMQ